jgi:hypothetical protein
VRRAATLLATVLLALASAAGAQDRKTSCAAAGLGATCLEQAGFCQQGRIECRTAPGTTAAEIAGSKNAVGIHRCICNILVCHDCFNNTDDEKARMQADAALYTQALALQSPTGAGSACLVSVSPGEVRVPSKGTAVTVTVSGLPSNADVEIEASRGDAADNFRTTKNGMADASGSFTAVYTYSPTAAETYPASGRITFDVKKPACGGHGSARYVPDAPRARLRAAANPLGIEKDAAARAELRIAGVGDIGYEIFQDGVSALSGTSSPQDGVRIIPFTIGPLAKGVTLTATVTDASTPPIQAGPLQVFVRPTAGPPPTRPLQKATPFCDVASNTIGLVLNVYNPDGLQIEMRAKVASKTVKAVSPVFKAIGTGSTVSLTILLPTRLPDLYKMVVSAYFTSPSGARERFYPPPGVTPVPIEFGKPPVKPGNIVALAEGDDCELCECTLGPPDADEDGVADDDDNCFSDGNPDQADSDSDGVGDVCDDCRDAPNAEQADADQDGVGDVCDTCPDVAGTTGADGDGDGIGDVCDRCPQLSDAEQDDADGDGVGDGCDNCPSDANGDQADGDGDGIGDACPEDVPCEAPACCTDLPKACGDVCWPACPEDHERQEADCGTCVEIADVNPPLVQIQAPAAGSSVPAGATVQVTTSFVDNGPQDDGVVSGTFTVSGPAVDGGPTPAGFDIATTPQRSQLFSFKVKSDLTGVSDRTIVITAAGRDAAGNASAVATETVVANGAGLSVLLSVSPSDPGAGETVTVTITVNNCDPATTQVSYTVAGTDGYGAADTLGVGASCQASFTIPGGASGVVDVVTVDVVGAGLSQTVSYSF